MAIVKKQFDVVFGGYMFNGCMIVQITKESVSIGTFRLGDINELREWESQYGKITGVPTGVEELFDNARVNEDGGLSKD